MATGATMSSTVTVAVQVLLLPAASVTVNVTVLAPTFAHVKVFGETLKVNEPESSLEPPSTSDAARVTLPVRPIVWLHRYIRLPEVLYPEAIHYNYNPILQ